MNLLSKNAPLEESIAKMNSVLASVGCKTTFSQQKHPLECCYSVNLTSVEAPEHIYSNGKGILPDASVASALGEYIERLQTNNFFIDFHLPKRKYYPDEVAFEFGGDYLSDELRKIYNPNGELSDDDLIDFNSDYEDKILSLPFVNQTTKESVYIPLNILSNLYVSNGLATGNTPLEAKVQALSEIFERYAKIEIIKNAYALPNFPDELVASFPRVHKDVLALRELGYIVEVLDASLGGEFPVTAISLINPNNSTLFVSFGAHPILEVSLERTMTELMQGRSLENLDTFEVPTFDMSIVAESFNLESHFVDSNGKLGFGFLSSKKSFEYSPFLYDGETSEQEYMYLTNILKKMKKDSYLREYDYLGFYSCQMIVPGISEVYPIDDLIYNNKNIGKEIRDMVLNFTDYDPQDILMSIEQLEDSLNMQKYIGVIFKENFNMSEFKAQIYLLLGEMDEALELLEFGTNKLGHIIVELAKMEEIELDFQEYEEGLYSVFGEQRVQKALRILDGDDFFIDTTLHSDYYNMLAMYDRLESKKMHNEIDLRVKPEFVQEYKNGYPLISKESISDFSKVTKEGEIINLVDSKNRFIAKGYYGIQNKGYGWVLTSKKDEKIDVDYFKKKIESAIEYRKDFFDDESTTAFRVFNGEGDRVGGLTIDYFDGFYLLTWYSIGIYEQKEAILEALKSLVEYKGIYQKKRFDSKGMYLDDANDFVCGEKADAPIIVKENGANFAIYLDDGPMVGVFLDQRDVRRTIRDKYAKDKTVLNTFSYTGAFSIFAALGGSSKTTSVDLANRSRAKTQEQFSVNNIDLDKQDIIVEDVFNYFKYAVRKNLLFDMVVLDPPSFARSKKHTFSASKDYVNLLKEAIQITNKDGIIVASTNSANFSMMTFRDFIFKAFKELKGKYTVEESFSLPKDFKVIDEFKEGDYLKVVFIRKDK